ncbi:hypothetical protein HUK45_04020 [Limosilactobacillus sp. c9Ua_26_M]|uniref:Uncharacterized protein n=1 Tax=Limosilactobacillus urinaemulieris TaxID=2742600 RepID=A0ABR8ZL60_9LACO|nr:hypothetical protein [Limosilactobacillus urinaemulieris]MBD8085421.1 hypothetical protein [Limosilactobacillus urinaemulieris]
MNSDNYKFILADDHKGNKALVVIKGELSTKLVSNAKTITDTRFNAVADQLKKIIDSASVIEKDGEHSCN